MYERKVVYLYQYHGNTPGKNVGYVKWSRNSEDAKLILNIKGLHLTKDMIGECSLLLKKRKVRLGKVYLKNAVAEGKYIPDKELCRRLSEEKESPVGILVTFGDAQCAASFSDEPVDISVYKETEKKAENRSESETGVKITNREDMASENKDNENKSEIKTEADIKNRNRTNNEININNEKLTDRNIENIENVNNKTKDEAAKNTADREDTDTVNKDTANKDDTDKKLSEVEMSDIYTRLKELFPTVHPFEKTENREYLSITPREIEFFRKEYFPLVNNSFLLHGYQNYKYLILGRDRDENQFLIGVPGVYFEKEEMMAKMFGFDLFVPALNEEKRQGSFGYYMKALK